MNKKQEDLMATGIWLLIKSSSFLKPDEKEVWMKDYDEKFGEKQPFGGKY